MNKPIIKSKIDTDSSNANDNMKKSNDFSEFHINAEGSSNHSEIFEINDDKKHIKEDDNTLSTRDNEEPFSSENSEQKSTIPTISGECTDDSISNHISKGFDDDIQFRDRIPRQHSRGLLGENEGIVSVLDEETTADEIGVCNISPRQNSDGLEKALNNIKGNDNNENQNDDVVIQTPPVAESPSRQYTEENNIEENTGDSNIPPPITTIPTGRYGDHDSPQRSTSKSLRTPARPEEVDTGNLPEATTSSSKENKNGRGLLKVGSQVLIKNLVNASHLNSKRAIVEKDIDPSSGRYSVKLLDSPSEVVNVKPGNVDLVVTTKVDRSQSTKDNTNKTTEYSLANSRNTIQEKARQLSVKFITKRRKNENTNRVKTNNNRMYADNGLQDGSNGIVEQLKSITEEKYSAATTSSAVSTSSAIQVEEVEDVTHKSKNKKKNGGGIGNIFKRSTKNKQNKKEKTREGKQREGKQNVINKLYKKFKKKATTNNRDNAAFFGTDVNENIINKTVKTEGGKTERTLIIGEEEGDENLSIIASKTPRNNPTKQVPLEDIFEQKWCLQFLNTFNIKEAFDYVKVYDHYYRSGNYGNVNDDDEVLVVAMKKWIRENSKNSSSSSSNDDTLDTKTCKKLLDHWYKSCQAAIGSDNGANHDAEPSKANQQSQSNKTAIKNEMAGKNQLRQKQQDEYSPLSPPTLNAINKGRQHEVTSTKITENKKSITTDDDKNNNRDGSNNHDDYGDIHHAIEDHRIEKFLTLQPWEIKFLKSLDIISPTDFIHIYEYDQQKQQVQEQREHASVADGGGILITAMQRYQKTHGDVPISSVAACIKKLNDWFQICKRIGNDEKEKTTTVVVKGEKRAMEAIADSSSSNNEDTPTTVIRGDTLPSSETTEMQPPPLLRRPQHEDDDDDIDDDLSVSSLRLPPRPAEVSVACSSDDDDNHGDDDDTFNYQPEKENKSNDVNNNYEGIDIGKDIILVDLPSSRPSSPPPTTRPLRQPQSMIHQDSMATVRTGNTARDKFEREWS